VLPVGVNAASVVWRQIGERSQRPQQLLSHVRPISEIKTYPESTYAFFGLKMAHLTRQYGFHELTAR
jgi:hypothetical protein